MPALQIGLNKPGSKLKGPSQNPLDRRKPIFDDDQDDGEDGGSLAIPTAAAPSRRKEPREQEITTFDETLPSQTSAQRDLPSLTNKPAKAASKPKLPSHQHTPTAPNLSALRTQHQHTADVDPSIYDYDAAYDALHAADSRRGASSKSKGSADKDAHLVNDLLAAAEVRKRDQQRAKERLLQKEREAEGDEFADKEVFVTDAYRAQQAEDAKNAEREAAREAEDARRRQAGMGMRGFYRGVMEQEEKRHQEMVEAAAQAAAGDADPAKGEAPASAEQNEADAAQQLKAQGKDVGVNDEGLVVDKRELLSAGLNVAPKPKSADAAKDSNGGRGPSDAQRLDARAGASGGRGRGDAQRAMRERQTRMMEAQLEQAAKRSAEETAEEEQRLERAAKSQKTAGDISSARERYLQRKREAAETASRGG